MKLPLSSINKSKIGTCPHGLPHGACPICSGMGGGGGSRKTESKPSGEMTWDECFAVGQMLKAQKLAQMQRQADQQSHLPLNFGAKLASVSANIALFSQKVASFAQKAESLPNIVSKPIIFVLNKLVMPTLNLLKGLPLFINKAINLVKEKITDISDKLSAMFGELKNSAEKKISDFLKDFKKRIKSLFDLPDTSRLDDEDKKIDEEKRILDFKNIAKFIREKFENKKKANVKYED